MKELTITEDNIQKLVDLFYKKIRSDKDLGPIFFEVIGEETKAWNIHLKKICNFWSSIMLGTKNYRGSPFQKHLMLPSFSINLFDRWLTLFIGTAQSLYIEEIANQFIIKSFRIAESLKLGRLYQAQRNINEISTN